MSKIKKKTAALVALFLTKGAKIFKLMKFSKLFVMFGSIVISTLVYAISLGISFAIGLVSMIFVHEMGHVLFMAKAGLGVRLPFFIPMFGAVIAVKQEEMKDPHIEAFVAYGGPLIGIAAGSLAYLAWALLPSHPEILLIVSHVAFLMNLFNLIPIRPLDGGRITQIVGSWIKTIGLCLIVSLVATTHDPMLMVIALMTVDDLSISKKSKAVVSTGGLLLLLAMLIEQETSWLGFIGISFLGISIVGYMWLVATKPITKKQEEQPEVAEPTPEVELGTRVKWLLAYLFLTTTAIILLASQIPYLPASGK